MARALLSLAVLSLCAVGLVQATPEKAARYYDDAQRRVDQSDLGGAVIQLKNALQEDNRMLAAHLLLGKTLLKNNDLKGAEGALEEALRQGVNRAEIALPLGQVYLTLGRPEAVIDRITTAGLKPSLQVDVLTMRGSAYLQMGRTPLAVQSFQEAKRLDPQAVGPVIAEIPMLLAGGDVERARENAVKAVKLAPNNANAWSMLASMKHLSFDAQGALAAYSRALSLDPRHVDSRVARSGLLLDLKRDAEARADIDYLAAWLPHEPRAAYLRAVLAMRQGDQAAALAALREVVKVVDALPARWVAHHEQLLMVGALAHHALGSREKARAYLHGIVTNNYRNLAARKLLATILVESRDYRGALPELEALRKAAPDDPQILFMLGSVHMAQRHYHLASELLERAAARTGWPDMTRMLAFSQLGQGHNELGIASLDKALAADPGDLQAGTTLAMIYLRNSQTTKAVQTAEALLKRHPKNLAVVNFLGLIKNVAGDFAGARAAYTQVVSTDPTFRPATLNLVKLDVGEGRLDDARRRLDAMLARRHDDRDALVEYGLLERRLGNWAEAIRHLKKASESQRRDPRAGLALVDLYLGRKQNEQATLAAKELSAKYPDTLPVQLALGRALLANGNMVMARTVFTGATRLAEYDAGMQRQLARWQLAAGNPDGALHNAQKALQGQPDDPAAMALVVEIETRRGDGVRADTALKALAAKHPKRLETALATADLAMSRGQFPVAVAAYRTALSYDATTVNALQLASALVAAGEPVDAAAFLGDWVRTHPKDLTALKALAEAQFRAGQLPAARQSYRQAIEAAPDDAAMLNNYANLLQQLNDPGAQAQAEKALRLDPDNPAYLDTLGWILVSQGRVDAGLRYLRDARLRSPENGEYRFHLAYALFKNGRTVESRDELSAALVGPGRMANSAAVDDLKRALGL